MKTMFILAITLLSMSAHSKTLTTPFKIKLVSVDGKIDFKKYSPAMRVSCSFTKLIGTGHIWEPQVPSVGKGSCGAYDETIILNANNELVIPAIRSTDDNQGVKLKNLSVEISLIDKTQKYWKNLVVISAAGKEVINQLVTNKEPINFYTASVNGINVSYEGADFFGSDSTREKNANFDFRFTNYANLEGPESASGKIWIDSSYTGNIFKASNGTFPDQYKLPEVKSIDLGDVIFARLGNRVETAKIEMYFYSEKTKNIHSGNVSIPVTVENLESLKSVTLK